MILTEFSYRNETAPDKLIVTTSWDDGHIKDFRVADLLEKYGLQGTFYVAPESRELAPGDRLGTEQIRELGQRFEIGAHTFSHPDLTKLPLDEALADIDKGRTFLEAATGGQITSFCYPYGKYNRDIARGLRGLGFTYARTVRQFEIREADPLTAGTTVHAYPHRSPLLNFLRTAGFNPLKARHYLDWSVLATDLFDTGLKSGGVFHLWGHSWEVDQHDDWKKLEQVFAYISSRQEVEYVPNTFLGKPPKTRLLIASSYFPPKMGGLERYAGEMAKGAVAAGHDVHVITSGTSRLTEEVNSEGVKIHRLPVQFKISDTPVSLRWITRVRKLIREINPDVINVHLPVPFLADLAALFAGNTPVIVTYHSGSMKCRGFLLDRAIDFYEKLLLPLSLKKASKIICASEFIRQNFLKKYLDKSMTIYPGVDTSVFQKRTAVPDNRNVIFVGDFRTAGKGLDCLREAIRLVPGTILHVVGKGNQIDSPQTVYHGELFGADLVAQIQDNQVLVLPSVNQSEGFGMVLIEAMACGVPVIGSDIGGISWVVRDHEDGLLVPARDPAALAAAINYIIDNPGAAGKFADRAYEKVTAAYRWETNVDEYLEQITMLLNHANQPQLAGRHA